MPKPDDNHTDRGEAHEVKSALRSQIAFLNELAGRDDAPRTDRLRAIELLATIATVLESRKNRGPQHDDDDYDQEIGHGPPHAKHGARKHGARKDGARKDEHGPGGKKHASTHASKHAVKKTLPGRSAESDGREPKRLSHSEAKRSIGSGARHRQLGSGNTH